MYLNVSDCFFSGGSSGLTNKSNAELLLPVQEMLAHDGGKCVERVGRFGGTAQVGRRRSDGSLVGFLKGMRFFTKHLFLLGFRRVSAGLQV
jgi:hypothetical protein